MSERTRAARTARVFWSAAGERSVHERYAALLRGWPEPAEQRRVPTGEGETFVLAGGPVGAAAVVLLHGAMTTSAMWQRSFAAWAERYRVYAVDLIGEPGVSAPSRPPLDSDRHACWLDDVLRALAIERAALVGASLGGFIALDYALRRPHRVAAVALLAPAGVGRIRPAFLLRAGPLLFLGPWGHRKALGYDTALCDAEKQSAAGRELLDFLDLTRRHYVARTSAWPTFADARLRTIAIPVLAMLGGRDAVLDSAETRRRLTSCVRRSRVVWLPDAGHGLVDPTAHVLAFLDGVSGD